MDNEFKGFMDSWNNSNIYLKLKAQLEEKRKALLEFKYTEAQINMAKKNIFSKKEIEQMADDVIFNFNLPAIYKDEQDYLWEQRIISTPKVELYADFNKEIMNWHYYLKIYISKEDYELAAKIRDVIHIKIIEFKENLEKYCEDFNEADEDEMISHIIFELRRIFQV